MSNNAIYERVHSNLLRLGLTTAQEMLDNWIRTSSSNEKSVLEILDHLFEQEVSVRRESAIRTRLKISGIPVNFYIFSEIISYTPQEVMKHSLAPITYGAKMILQGCAVIGFLISVGAHWENGDFDGCD